MKARAGWKEKHEIEATVATNQRYVISAVPAMTEEEWLATRVPRDGD